MSLSSGKYIIATALVVLLLAACINDHEEDGGMTSLVNVGDAIPSFTLSGPDGKNVSADDLEGQAYILNFFDTACPDCRQELTVLQRIYDKYRQNLPVLNVPRSQTREEVEDYWQTAGLTMPFYIAYDKDLYYKFAKRTIPRTYLVDGNGKICAAFSDSPTADYETLDSLLHRLAITDGNGADSVSLSLRLKVGAASQLGSNIDEYYFHNEYTVSRLDVYFYDADTRKFFTKAILKDLTQAESLHDTEYDITYILDDLKLKAGVYDIFAIANYDNSPDEVEDEDDFLNMVDTMTYNEGIEANIPDKGPVMTSRATSLLAVDLIPWINKDYVLNVEMERVIAKLLIGVSQNTFQLVHGQRKYADINITNYKLVNLNRQYYLFQHKDSLPEFKGQPQFVLPNNFGDYNDKGEQYVVDPLFYKKTLNSQDARLFSDYYKSWFGTFTTENFASMPSADNHGYAYILENTSFKTCQKNGYSPGIVFKAAVSPVFIYLYDQKQRTLEEEYRPEYWPKTIYLYEYNFYGSIQAVNVASGLSLDELETYTDSQLKAYGIKQCKFNMGVYETYYTYWIHHRNSYDDHMGPMQYGIVRNNFYKIIVTGISGLGNSSISPEIMRDNYPNSYVDVTVN